jgi:hypothetical protein
VSKGAGSTTVDAKQENYNKKGKLNGASNYTIACTKGLLMFDMKTMVPEQQQEAYKDMVLEVDGAPKELPINLTVGSKLKDANVKFKVKTKEGGEIPFGTFGVNITERKVEAKESVITTAGTFECYKFSEMVEVSTIVKIKYKTISWFSLEVGTVKSEVYKESGKFISKTELTELVKR